jgi:PAS domain S-box-containing protein
LNGDPLEVLAVTRDITKTRLAEEALRESEERFRLIVENCNDLVAELAHDGRFLYANPAFQRALGPEMSPIPMGNIFERVFPDDLLQARKIFDTVGERARFRLRQAGGNWRWVEASGQPFRDSSGNECVALIARDVTQRVESDAAHAALEIRLQHAQKMESLGTLAGGIAHDFNNILAAIIGYVELARLTIPPENPALDALTETMKASARATDLVRQILTFSRQKEHERRVIPVGPVVREVSKLLRAALPSSIDIQTVVASGAPNVLADASQLHQALMNLGMNAAHAMRKDGGVLEIVVSRIVITDGSARAKIGLTSGLYLRIVVRDTGEGIATEVLPRIFEPFFTTKAVGEGTGLGLAVVHGIVKSHDGAISVTSQPGMGSSFEIYLPAVEDGVSIGPVPREVPRGHGEMVLYVDDEAALGRLVQQSLERTGYHGVVCTDPLIALKLFIEDPNRFAVVITDFTMPKMSGIEFISEVKKISTATKVIITTGFTGNLDFDALRGIGVDEVLSKPFTVQRLAECLQRALAKT